MNSFESQLTRPQREALDRQDAPFLLKPLSADTRSVAAHVRHMAKLMRSRRSHSPCSDAISHFHAMFERSVVQRVPPASQALLACKKGCAHCCAQPVGITAPDVFYLARILREQESIVAAVLDAGKRIEAAPKNQRLFNMRCPMLVDSTCSVHPARPLSCRVHASFDVNKCIAKYAMLGSVAVMGPAEIDPLRNDCWTILFASIGLIGRNDFTATYEMNAALSHVLRMDGTAEKRWLAGEDVMAGVDILPDVDRMSLWHINRVIDALRPTL